MTGDRSRWLILALVVLAQLMVVPGPFWWSAAIFAAAALVCGLMLTGRPSATPAEPVPVAAP